MNSYLPFNGRKHAATSRADSIAVDRLSALTAGFGSAQKLDARLAAMIAGLHEIDHTQYEPALTELGKLLGADASKPDGDGRTDSQWCWGNELWVTVEAKPESTGRREILTAR